MNKDQELVQSEPKPCSPNFNCNVTELQQNRFQGERMVNRVNSSIQEGSHQATFTEINIIYAHEKVDKAETDIKYTRQKRKTYSGIFLFSLPFLVQAVLLIKSLLIISL